ncbi:MAG: hypothetical protein JO337_13595 [Acidimicrobiales bacterium]|nr:hypothetical protein [Acidimicrobiales bacterium]
MPWCDDCSQFWNEKTLHEGGTCPSCGRAILTARKPVPWHFKLVLVAFAGYMVYRVYWLVQWLPHHI